MEKIPKEKEVERFFFKAMLKGWGAEKPEKIKIPMMPGYKGIDFREGDFYLLDLYCTTPYSNESGGTTTIWHRDIPVWFMSYQGWYHGDAIAVVKEALMIATKKKLFFGGRGWPAHEKNGLIYANTPRINDFLEFEGMEMVAEKKTGDLLGYHNYQGRSLL